MHCTSNIYICTSKYFYVEKFKKRFKKTKVLSGRELKICIIFIEFSCFQKENNDSRRSRRLISQLYFVLLITVHSKIKRDLRNTNPSSLLGTSPTELSYNCPISTIFKESVHSSMLLGILLDNILNKDPVLKVSSKSHWCHNTILKPN